MKYTHSIQEEDVVEETRDKYLYSCKIQKDGNEKDCFVKILRDEDNEPNEVKINKLLKDVKGCLTFFDYERDDNDYILYFDKLIIGLDDYIRYEGSTNKIKASILMECVKTVNRMHVLDIVHCDIKPSNVMIVKRRTKK